ncbi:MAG: hypothetical protein ACYCZ7_01990, partial [Minisyncoccota bacterium]
IKTVAASTNIMNKLFVIVVPYSPPKPVTMSASSEEGAKGILSGLLGKKSPAKPVLSPSMIEAFEEAKSQLEQRAGIISQGLIRTGVRVVPLGTEELTELYYHLFNPGEEEKQIAAK